MSTASRRPLASSAGFYWFLFALQTAGVLIILWQGLPIYRLIIRNPGPQHTTSLTFQWALGAIALIQLAYWLRVSRARTPALRPNIILNHLLLFAGRLNFVFGAAMFSTILYLRYEELTVSPSLLALLLGTVFSLFCYSLELENVALAAGPHRK